MSLKFVVLFSTVILLTFVEDSQSICVSRRTEWGEVGAFFTDPLCDVWCRIRACGKGECREDRTLRRANNARCMCEKCYRDDDGTVIYPNDDGLDWTRTNSNDGNYRNQNRNNNNNNRNMNDNGYGSSNSNANSNQNQNQRTQDDLYPSQSGYDSQYQNDNNRYNSNQ